MRFPVAVRVRAPAKINLALQVGPVDSDGYHPLQTVFQAISLYDELTVRAGSAPEEAGTAEDTSDPPFVDGGLPMRLSITGEGAGKLSTGGDNLVVQAVRALAEHAGVAEALQLHLHKAIPVAAGLAGGSADAAAALVACDEFWGTRVPAAQLRDLAAGLGSDVPFCLAGHTMLGRGRGEQLTPVLAPARRHWVLGIADAEQSTDAVYTEFDRLRALGRAATADGALEQVLVAARQPDPAPLAAALHNDLQPAAISLRPQLRRTLAAAEEIGAATALVSGSGPTVLFPAADAEQATAIAARLSGLGVCRTVRTATGPVPGAGLS